MKIVDSDGNSVTLGGGTFTSREGKVKLVQHEYLFSDDTDVTWLGRGPITLQVRCVCTSTDDLEELVDFLVRDEEFVLWWPSTVGGEDDRYYQRVIPTSSPSIQSPRADLHVVTLSCLALDPHVYDEDGLEVA